MSKIVAERSLKRIRELSGRRGQRSEASLAGEGRGKAAMTESDERQSGRCGI